VRTLLGGGDAGGFQIGTNMSVFQWRDGKKVIVWPEEVVLGKPWLPTPRLRQR